MIRERIPLEDLAYLAPWTGSSTLGATAMATSNRPDTIATPDVVGDTASLNTAATVRGKSLILYIPMTTILTLITF